MRLTLSICLSAALLVVASCGSEPAVEPEPLEPAATGTTDRDPVTGTWTGDWGPTPTHRNPVTVELNWDGDSLTGTVNPGPEAVELSATSFDPAAGTVRMEADAEGLHGPVHYMIEGQVAGETMTGSWIHDGGEGDFQITRE